MTTPSLSPEFFTPSPNYRVRWNGGLGEIAVTKWEFDKINEEFPETPCKFSRSEVDSVLHAFDLHGRRIATFTESLGVVAHIAEPS